MTQERKHEVKQTTPLHAAATIAIAPITHPHDIPLSNANEQRYLALFASEDTNNATDAYQVLLGRLRSKTLSLAALYQFANYCYRYWAQQLPQADAFDHTQAVIARSKEQCKALAKGRLLYRQEIDGQLQYYWANDPISQTTLNGVFYLCYDAFELAGLDRSTASLSKASPVTDAALISVLTKQEAAEQITRQQQQVSQAVQDLASALRQQAPVSEQHIADYRLAQLYSQAGYVTPITDSLASSHPFMARLLGHQALQQWRSETPLPLSPLTAATITLREQAEATLIQQARQAILQQRLQACQSQLDSHTFSTPTALDIFRQLTTEALALLETEISSAQKTALLASLCQHMHVSEYEDAYRQALGQLINKLTRPGSTVAGWSLAEVTAFVTRLITAWHRHGKNELALTQLRFYRQLLQTQLTTLQGKAASYADSHQEWWQQTTQALHEGLRACETSDILLTQPLTIATPTPLPSSRWSERTQMLQHWHRQIAREIKDSKPQPLLQVNTDTAQKLIQHMAQEIEAQLGSAPCAFALLGAGSYSRGETSFGSDIDFAVLISDAAVQQHAYFQGFLDLLAFKTASFPDGVFPLEAKELSAMKKGECWIDTPANLIAEHCYLPGSERGQGSGFDHSFPLRWPKLLYTSQHPAANTLWQEYQNHLTAFFQQRDSRDVPYYRLIEPWTLQQHLKKDDALSAVAAGQAETKPVAAQPRKANLKATAYPLYTAVLCWGRFTGETRQTETMALLDHLNATSLIAPAFLARLSTALTDIQQWRLRLHWARLHDTTSTELHHDEVFLWPTDTAQQQTLQSLPRALHLDASESQRWQDIETTVAEVIHRSMAGFSTFAAQLPTSTVLPSSPNTASPSSLSSSSTTTTSEVKDTKETEAKREVTEEEAQKIIALQPHAVAEAKNPAPSPITPTFNPLGAAVEWTLQQLRKSNDSKTSEPKHASQTEHVIWLAQVIGACATELQENKPNLSGPARVKQDPLFRKHWRVYWRIPQQLRGTYLARLSQSPAIDAATLVKLLQQAPNTVGWRLSTQISEQQWQQALRPLFAAEPQASLPPEAKKDIKNGTAVWVSWVEQGTVLWAPLQQKYANELIDAKENRWRRQHNEHGNHRLYNLKTQSHSFWVKAYPEQPSTEYLVTALDRRLGINGTPQQQLMALHHTPLRVTNGTPEGMLIEQSAILLSQHVADAKDTLHHCIRCEPQALEKLDFIAFAKTLLRVLLTNPEDDKGSDYFLVSIPDTDLYQLIRIDNERAFLSVTHITAGKRPQEELQVKSVLYCLDQMLLPWSNDQRTTQLIDDLCRIQPSALIMDLLKDIEQQHIQWKQLFSEKSVDQHACLQDPWMSIPTFLLPQGLESALLKRLTSMQTALRLLKPQTITGLKLLELVQPKLGRYYNQSLFQGKLARDLQKPQANVQGRFNYVAGCYYKLRQQSSSGPAVSGDYQTSTASGPVVLSRQLSITLPVVVQEQKSLVKFVQDIWSQEAHSVRQALETVSDPTSTKKHLQAKRVAEGLSKLQKKALTQFGWLPAREQQQVLEQLLSKPLETEQQRFLLAALVDAQCHNLDLQPFAKTLTETLLLPLLTKSGQQLLRLNISGCTLLRPGILATIAKHCKHLQRLTANDQTHWTQLSLGGFEALTHFECNNATTLTYIQLGHLPALKELSLKNAAILPALANQGWGILAAGPWDLPALQSINLHNCRQLRSIRLQVEQPEQLSWQVAGCDQLQPPHIQSSHHKDYLVSVMPTEEYLPELSDNPVLCQWFLACLPHLTQIHEKGAENLLNFAQQPRRIPMLLAMSLFAHNRKNFAFTATLATQEAYAVWEAVVKANATAGAYASHLPHLLSLKSNGLLYEFKNPSYDFWLASALLEMAQADTMFQAAVLDFFNRCSIQNTPTAMKLLAEMIQPTASHPLPARYIAFRDFLFDIIKRSAREPRWAQASSNAATLLNACREPLTYQSWAGVQLPGADLRYCVLAHSNLSGANLQGAALTGAVLFQTNLGGANLRKVKWTEPQPLESKTSASPKVLSVAYRLDGRCLASGSGDSAIRQWDARTGLPLGAPLIGNTDEVTSVVYSPDSCHLASGSKDGTIHQWDARTGQLLATLSGQSVCSVVYNPDGRYLASRDEDGVIQQWDTQTGRPFGEQLKEAKGTAGTTSVAYSPDGCRLAASGGKSVYQWDTATSELLRVLTVQEPMLNVAYSPDGCHLIAWGSESIYQWDTTKTDQPRVFKAHGSQALSLAYSLDGRYLACGGKDGRLRLRDAESGAQVGELQWCQTITTIAFSQPYPPSTAQITESTAVSASNPPTARGLQYQLAIGDETGTVSCWVISIQGSRVAFWPMSMSDRSKMPFTANGAILKGCRMEKGFKCWLEKEHGADVRQVKIEGSDVQADSKTSQHATIQITPPAVHPKGVGFFPAPRSQPIETKETKRAAPLQQAQERLTAIEARVDVIFPPTFGQQGTFGRKEYLRRLLPYQRRRDELTLEDLNGLEAIEKELQEQQQALINSFQPMG